LQAGLVVVIPERTPENQSQIGWWLVDPANGRTRDRMDDGRGNAQVEYTPTLATVLKVSSCIIALVSLLGSTYQFVAKRLGRLTPAEDDFWDYVGITTEVVGFFTGAGCVASKWVVRPRPAPRYQPEYRRVPGSQGARIYM
jgi:hypothetical protein